MTGRRGGHDDDVQGLLLPAAVPGGVERAVGGGEGRVPGVRRRRRRGRGGGAAEAPAGGAGGDGGRRRRGGQGGDGVRGGAEAAQEGRPHRRGLPPLALQRRQRRPRPAPRGEFSFSFNLPIFFFKKKNLFSS